MKRIFLFLVVNLLVVLSISFFINLLGLRPYMSARGIDYRSLLAFCAVWGFAGSFISLQLSRWTAKMAMGVELIDPDKPGSAFANNLVAVIRDLCRQAGLRTLPEIGVYQSPEVNAFATGPSKSRSLLAISSGLLNNMDQEAIKGVLGHEVSHIANGDMVTMTLLQGVVNTFVMFFSRAAVFALDSYMRGNDDRRERGGGLGYFAHSMLIWLFDTLFTLLSAPLIYYFSRVREYKADADSAKIGGRDTMVHALESLKRCTQVQDNRAPALSAFKINGHGHGLMALLFASHPPIDARIEALRKG